MAAQSPATVKLEVELRFSGPHPLELEVSLMQPDGSEETLDCAVDEYAAWCEGVTGGSGGGQVMVNYRAVDERLESVDLDLLLHGDEEEVAVGGSFDDDASLPHLTSHIYRSAGSGVSLDTVEGGELGELPFFKFSNESDSDIVTLTQGGLVLGYVVRVREDGSRELMPGGGGGCGTGLGFSAISPGTSALGVTGIRLPRGSYLYVVEFDDAETGKLAHVSRRTATSFEVREEGPVRIDPRLTDWGWYEWHAPDLWAGATPPSRPGQERPVGREGSQGFEGAPSLADGSNIAGALSPNRHRHTYRLQLQPDEEAVVRIFARCTEAPCSELAGIYSGDDDDHISGSSRALHRDPPAWSLRESIVREEDAFVIGCRQKCAEGWEFYGRVHIRRLSKYER